MKILKLFLLTFFWVTSHAQKNNTYQADLIELKEILKKTPSYKDQIKGQRLRDYNSLFEKLLNDTVSIFSDYQYFYNIAQIFFPIRDNHLAFYQIANFPSPTDFPTFKGNLDSLKLALSTKPLDSLEGIYHYDKYYSVGLFKAGNAKYVGVVLDTEISNWKKGQIAIHLYEYLPQYFKAIYAHPKFKNYILHPIERFTHHSLVNSYFYSSFSETTYSKINYKKDFTNLPKNIGDFGFKNIEAGIQYLHIKHFSADRVKMQKSKDFYDSIKNLLTAPNLILDLRNNDGGANKVSKKFLSLIKQYTKKGQVYVLINNSTLSQGEIFTLQLKQLHNVETLGQTTKGMLSYGSNYGKRVKLPSQSFEVYITDMKGKGAKRLLPYENIGITPDIILTDTRDWIAQTIDIIRNK
ncbi:MAG: S41 family peptidase [Chitinophagaceae bacterium]